MRVISVTAVFLVVLWPLVLKAQLSQDSVRSGNLTYTNQINSGVLFGKGFTGNTITVSTVHGIRWGRFSGGLGIGYETYSEHEVMPVFVSFAIAFTPPERNYFFFEAEVGYSAAWHMKMPFSYYSYEEHGGRTLKGALGYRIKAADYSFYVKTGYKSQTLKYDEFLEWSPGYVNRVERDMERFVVTIGFGFR